MPTVRQEVLIRQTSTTRSNNDRFITSGESASITGPGFASYTKFFEQVNAYATAGGKDVAMLYGSSNQTQWQQGADFVNFRESTWNREARGFQSVETYVGGQMLNVPNATMAALFNTPPATSANADGSTSSDIGQATAGEIGNSLKTSYNQPMSGIHVQSHGHAPESLWGSELHGQERVSPTETTAQY